MHVSKMTNELISDHNSQGFPTNKTDYSFIGFKKFRDL